jgi:hypothetical protein
MVLGTVSNELNLAHAEIVTADESTNVIGFKATAPLYVVPGK